MERFAPIHIIKGSDDVILNDEVSKLLNELLGDDDRTLVWLNSPLIIILMAMTIPSVS